MSATGYHFSGKILSRRAGQSAVAAVAYRTGERLTDERTGEVKDYSRKSGVEFVFHAAPKAAPEWANHLEKAWNMKERAEDQSTCRATAQLARNYDMAFPHQLTAGQREWMLKDFVREEFTRKDLLATAVIHAPPPHGDERNHHAHILVSDRTLDADGFSKKKDRHWKTKAEQKTYEAKALAGMRKKWADLGARQLERAGFGLEAERWRHGHKTLAEQRDAALARGDVDFAKECEREPENHLGPHGAAMERKGIPTERGDENRAIRNRNAALQDLKREAQVIDLALERELRRPDFVPEKYPPMVKGLGNDSPMPEPPGAAQRDRPANQNRLEFRVPQEPAREAREIPRAEPASAPPKPAPELDPEAAKAKALALAETIRKRGGKNPNPRAVEKTLQSRAQAGRELDPEQTAAVRHATENKFAVIQGRAGTGKSFTLNAIRESYERGGYEVIGLAPTHAAAHELREAGFEKARTLHSFLYAEQKRIEQGRAAPEQGSRVLILDEAGMVGNSHLAAILETAAAHGARVVLAGDDRQLKSIEQGGLFGVLAKDQAAELTTVYRQRDDWQKDATRAFAQGDTAGGLRAYHERGFIHYAEGKRTEAAAELVQQWVADRDAGREGCRFVFSVTNADTHALNAMIQAEQIKAGLVKDPLPYTVADGREIHIGEGDRVQLRGTDKANGIFNGMLATVEKIGGGDSHLLNLRLDTGEAKTIDTTAYSDIELGYAGTVFRGQGKTLDRSYVLFSPYMDGRATYVASTRAREETHIYAATGDLNARHYRGYIRAEGLVMPETPFDKLVVVIEGRSVYNEQRPPVAPEIEAKSPVPVLAPAALAAPERAETLPVAAIVDDARDLAGEAAQVGDRGLNAADRVASGLVDAVGKGLDAVAGLFESLFEGPKPPPTPEQRAQAEAARDARADDRAARIAAATEQLRRINEEYQKEQEREEGQARGRSLERDLFRK